MRLTRKKSIELSKKLWKFLADTGLLKKDWPEFVHEMRWGDNHYSYQGRDISSGCFLCEVVKGDCDKCPYYQKFAACYYGDKPYSRWDDATTKRDRKKFAKLFLAQLEELDGTNEVEKQLEEL